MLPDRFSKEYDILINTFRDISEERNETIKAIYAFDYDNATIFRINQNASSNPNDYENFDKFIQTKQPQIFIEDLNNLLKKLEDLKSKILILEMKIFTDKLKFHSSFYDFIGDSHPAYARVNPYKYKNELESAAETK